jgi:predicted nuclease of restriction endonuclease-like (RecB) superfamily
MMNNKNSKPIAASAPSSKDFEEVLHRIRQTRERVFAQANTVLIELYWQIGETISDKVARSGWGKGVVSELARYIARTDPEIKGFSDKNLWRMKQFYETYREDPKLATLWRELSWTHNAIIFSRCKSPEEREYYLRLATTEKLTKRELERQIDSAHFERSLAEAKLSPLVRVLHPTAERLFRDSYVLEFLGLPDTHSEGELQAALTRHMKAFVLELGRDFIFVGEEFRLQVGNQDFFVDLLFFHRGLSALVAFELKIGKFSPEDLGQLNFYLEALDRDVKKPHENPSIGILLCRDKDDEVVEYALSRHLSPTLIAQYRLQLPDKKLLQAKLHEIFEHARGDEA